VFLTGDGRALAQRLVSDARDHEAQILSKLELADADAIKPTLRALLARMDDSEDR